MVRSLNARLIKLIQVMALGLWVGVIGLISPNVAWASQWYPVAETPQADQEQFVDLDSIQALGQQRVRVHSYYLDHRQGNDHRTTYITEYDCGHRWFRDVVYNEANQPLSWHRVDPDRLNTATMEYVCTRVGYTVLPESTAKN
jgi:hypothetical protein